MYYYSIGYTSYEDSGFAVLMNEQQFSSGEFNAMVFSCVSLVAQETKSYYEQSEFQTGFGYYSVYDKLINVKFSDIYETIADKLCEKFDFAKLEYQADFALFGWPNLNEKEDWDYDDERHIKISEMFMDALKDVKIHPEHTNDFGYD